MSLKIEAEFVCNIDTNDLTGDKAENEDFIDTNSIEVYSLNDYSIVECSLPSDKKFVFEKRSKRKKPNNENLDPEIYEKNMALLDKYKSYSDKDLYALYEKESKKLKEIEHKESIDINTNNSNVNTSDEEILKWKEISQSAVYKLLKLYPITYDDKKNSIKKILDYYQIPYSQLDYDEEEEEFM